MVQLSALNCIFSWCLNLFVLVLKHILVQTAPLLSYNEFQGSAHLQ